MLDELSVLVGYIFATFSQIWQLYIRDTILTGVFALWLLRRVSRLFDKLR